MRLLKTLMLLVFSVVAGAEEYLSPGLTPEQVFARLSGADTLLVIDVRKPVEFKAGHIPGAINIPIDKLEKRVVELQKDRDVLVYCINGTRTRKAEPILIEHGVEQLYHLEGAFFAWKKSGLDVETGWSR